MDWTKQNEEMFQAWTESQKKLWDSWLETVDKGPMAFKAGEAWQKTLETWESAMNNTLSAQTEWTKMWAESLAGTKNIPEEMVEWARHAQEMNKRWTEAQQQLWQSWFDLARKIDPGKMSEDWSSEGQNLYQSWQDAARKIMEEQLKWVSTWTAAQAETKTGENS